MDQGSGPAFQIDFYSASTFITLFHTNWSQIY